MQTVEFVCDEHYKDKKLASTFKQLEDTTKDTTRSIEKLHNVLTQIQQTQADRLEKEIEDCLDAMYDHDNPKAPIRIETLEDIPVEIMEYLRYRFSGWSIQCDTEALEFTPK
jgi:hypothetical protein